ncbi:Fer-1-like protein 4 [Manis javanica]|nr:Fer-1-like protein 4 [Manis javanica]
MKENFQHQHPLEESFQKVFVRSSETQFLPIPRTCQSSLSCSPHSGSLVIECWAFGRTVLMGSHIVPYLLRFTLQGHEDPPEEEGEEEDGPKGPQSGNNLMSVDGEAQDQGEPEVKDSMSQKKAIATLKIYISSLEEEFNHFEDWLNVFLCTKGMGARMEMERKKGLDPLWASSSD